MELDLGRVTPLYRKQYDEATAYELNDVVLYTDGNLYWHVAAEQTTGVPPTDATVWTLAFSGADLRQEMVEDVAVAKTAANRAETAAVRQPYPNPDTGTWWAWNAAAEKYEDTGVSSAGNTMYATFDIDPATGELIMTAPDGYAGPKFAINENGELEVSING